MTVLDEDAPLSAEDILTFGPCVEAQVWEVAWLQEKRAPIARAAGRAKLGPIFNEQGVGNAVLIRPCMSRGRRVRGLAPVYTPTMLEGAASVFDGWPMYMDHVAEALAEAMARKGRSVKELGGQVLTGTWAKDFVQEYDATYGYQKGGVLAEVWATPFIRKMVGENADLLHTSISAWPTAGKPGPVPWAPGKKGMVIEGIRKQPQGSVDFVPRGGAGGRLLLAEGEDPDERAWPEPGWSAEETSFVVSLAEEFYASPAMTPPGKKLAEMNAEELRAHLREEGADHLLTALREESAPAPAGPTLTEADVQRLVATEVAKNGAKPVDIDALREELREEFAEQATDLAEERDEQRALSTRAHALIEAAEGIGTKWKADLKTRYSMLPEGPSPALLVEEDDGGEDGAHRTKTQVLEARVAADLDHSRDLVAEAIGKPRVKGEGGATSKATGRESARKSSRNATPEWRQQFADLGIVESEESALAIHGVSPKQKVED